MAREAILKGILSRVGINRTKTPSAWRVIEIERMLGSLNIGEYEFIYEAKVVKLNDKEQLMQILHHMMPSKVSDGYHLALNDFNDKARLRVGGWQFEAGA